MEPEIDLQRRESRHGDGKSDTAASDNDGQRELVYFRDHLGERYAFPFEQCVSRGSIQYLFSEIYTLRDQSFLERITKRDFIIQTDGATILPDFWGTAIKPGMTIDIKFPEERVDNGSRDHSTHHSRSASPEIEIRGPRSRFVDESEYVEAVTRDDPRPTSPAPAQQQSDYSTDSDSEQSAGLSEGEFVPVADMPDFLRQVLPPLDAEGNQLSFQVDTKHRQKLIRPKEEADAQKNEKQARAAGKGVGDYHVETFRITKAMVEVADGKGQIKVYVLPGPETPHFEEAVTCTWYHISGGQLDFTRFRDVCLTMPHLNDRLRKLTSEMLNKVYSEKVKPFDGGMFIEPGTVLRADESDQPDPQSVIFSCVPYLGLNPLAKRSARTDNTQFPQRTLMETFYPYEPVHERDSEQSYRRFGNERSDSVIHVPNLWMMNIGSNVVVTHGHARLSKEMTNSMTVIEEDIKQLGTQTVPENNVTKIRLTDSGGRDFIFPPSVCRSYLQMEARVREIEYVVNGTSVASRIFLKHKTRNGSFRVLTEHWKYLIAQNNVISINLIQVSESEVAQLERTSITTYTTKSREVSKLPPMPPFFEWPQSNASTAIRDCKTTDQNPYSPLQAIGFLEQIDKAMMTEVLRGRATSVIHRAFESTHYYESLPEAHYAVVRDSFAALRQQFNQRKGSLSQSSFHQVTVNTQRTEMMEKSLELFNLVRNIVTLFVSNMDEGRVIGKTWGAMAKLLENIANIEDDRPSDQDSDRHKTHGLERGQARQFGRSWLIRNTSRLNLTPIPDSKPELLEKITKCKRSKKFHAFSSLEDAVRHLQYHTNSETEPGKHWATTETEKLPDYHRKGQEGSLDPQLKDWVMTSAEFWREQTNAGVLVILTMACKLAKDISEQAEELIDGVQNENGQMSELYTLPKELTKAFRLIVTFFMATERALYGVNDTMEQEISFKVRFGDELLPYPKRVCNTLKVFGQTAIRSLRIARSRMCYMARTNPPLDLMGHLSFGSEYICAWLIRRLSLKPLEKHQTAGDLYREYISRLQFQVNHHPSKRLLRDLNLLQEELQILNLVTVQQRELARNYSCVLDDLTYEKESLSRKSMYSHERALLDSCITNLDLVSEDYRDLIRRCGPLADRTKQSLEINEEDHGKAIMVFTVVTVIFLPLSFVTSYMGMNTVDIRDMNQGQGLFWSVATPLTVVTVGICLLIGYNGDGIRDMISSLYRKATGKQERNTGGGGMSVPRRKRPLQLSESSSTTLGSSNIPNEAEFANPRPVFQYDTQIYTGADERFDDDVRYTRRLHTARPEVRTQTYAEPVVFDQIPTYKTGYSSHRPRHNRRDNYAQDEHDGGHVSGRYESYPIPPPPRRGTYDVDRDSFTGYPRRNPQARIVRLEMPSRGPPLGPYETEPMDENEAELYSWEKKRSTQRSGGRRIEREYRDRVHDDWGDEDSNGESWYRRRERRRDDYRDEYRER